jgi:predicted ATPase
VFQKYKKLAKKGQAEKEKLVRWYFELGYKLITWTKNTDNDYKNLLH